MTNTIFYYSDNTTSTTSDTVLTINSRNFDKTLISVSIGDAVTSLGQQAFSNCASLTNINIPNHVTSIGDAAFNNCTSLTSVTIPNSVTSIGNSAFQNCTNLTSINLSRGLQSIGSNAFTSCISLLSLDIPSTVNSIGNRAFNVCSSLRVVTIPSQVKFLDDFTFYNDTNLLRVNFLGNAPALGTGVFLNTNINLKIYRYSTKSGWSSTFDGKNVLLIDTPNKGLKSFGFSGGSSSGKVSIKKQNLGGGRLLAPKLNQRIRPYVAFPNGTSIFDETNLIINVGDHLLVYTYLTTSNLNSTVSVSGGEITTITPLVVRVDYPASTPPGIYFITLTQSGNAFYKPATLRFTIALNAITSSGSSGVGIGGGGV